MSNRIPAEGNGRRKLNRIKTYGAEYDFLNQLTDDSFVLKQDFYGITTLPTQYVGSGGGGTAAALVSLGPTGQVNLVTSGSDNACSILYLAGGNFTGDMNPVLKTRFSVSSLATGNVMIGWSDNIAATVLTSTGIGPFVSPLADPPTLVSTTADAACAVYDLSSGLTNPSFWKLATAIATVCTVTTPTTTAATLKVHTAGTMQTVTVRLIGGTVVMYINDVETARLAGAITSTVPLYPFALIGATSGTSRTMTMDYFNVYADRDTSI